MHVTGGQKEEMKSRREVGPQGPTHGLFAIRRVHMNRPQLHPNMINFLPNQPYSSIIPREAHHPQNSGDRHNKTDRSFLKKEKEDRQTSSASSTASISPPFHVSCCWTERLHHYSQLIVPK